MYKFIGIDSERNYKFHLIEQNKYISLSIKLPKFKYYLVQNGDFIIYQVSEKSPFRGIPRYKLGDIIYINNPDRDEYNYDGLKIRKATQFEFDRYEYNNFPNISSNSRIYEFLKSLKYF
tara:strand:- start:727 stop:1083 length:357 start_codon:yes stop_codon:yes gene_type:complete